MMKNLRHRIPGGTSSLIRCLSAAAQTEETVQLQQLAQSGIKENLYRQLSALGTKKGEVGRTLNKYVRKGNVVSKRELQRCITELRKFRKHQQALEIMEWMESRGINLSYGDCAVCLDLIYKAQGRAAAENYFDGLSPSAKNMYTYGSLLNCYCMEKMMDKALDLFKKMDEMDMLSNPLPFNNILSLYMKLGNPEEVSPLVEEMKKRNIQPDTFTYNIWMTSCSSLNDVEGVERVFEEIKRNHATKCDWTTYSNLAAAYVKVGFHEKAELALKKLEQEIGPRNRPAYHFLISLYSGISSLGEVHRIWNTLKLNLAATNMSYLVLFRALRKLKDIDGLKKCFKEWESSCSSYDTRLPSVVIDSFLRHDMLDEAESVLHNAIERSQRPFFKAREMFITFFLNKNNIEQALQYLEAAISLVKGNEWHPGPEMVKEFLKYFKERKDVDGAQKVYECLKKVNCLDHDVCNLLLEIYVAAGRMTLDLQERIKRDGFKMSY